MYHIKCIIRFDFVLSSRLLPPAFFRPIVSSSASFLWEFEMFGRRRDPTGFWADQALNQILLCLVSDVLHSCFFWSLIIVQNLFSPVNDDGCGMNRSKNGEPLQFGHDNMGRFLTEMARHPISPLILPMAEWRNDKDHLGVKMGCLHSLKALGLVLHENSHESAWKFPWIADAEFLCRDYSRNWTLGELTGNEHPYNCC